MRAALALLLTCLVCKAQTVTLLWDYPVEGEDTIANYTFKIYSTDTPTNAMPWTYMTEARGVTNMEIAVNPIAGTQRYFYVTASRPSTDSDLWEESDPCAPVAVHWLPMPAASIRRTMPPQTAMKPKTLTASTNSLPPIPSKLISPKAKNQ